MGDVGAEDEANGVGRRMRWVMKRAWVKGDGEEKAGYNSSVGRRGKERRAARGNRKRGGYRAKGGRRKIVGD